VERCLGIGDEGVTVRGGVRKFRVKRELNPNLSNLQFDYRTICKLNSNKIKISLLNQNQSHNISFKYIKFNM
jgi:hypothetical protein